MSPLEAGIALTLTMLVVVDIGVHIGIALILSSFIGIWLIQGSITVASHLLGMAAADSIANYVFGVIPLFVLMGVVVSESDIGRDTFDVAQSLVRLIKGGMGIATVAAETEKVAHQALSLIEVEYEPLPAVFDPQEALGPDALAVHGKNNLLFCTANCARGTWRGDLLRPTSLFYKEPTGPLLSNTPTWNPTSRWRSLSRTGFAH